MFGEEQEATTAASLPSCAGAGCLDQYFALRVRTVEGREDVDIDPRLVAVAERMMSRYGNCSSNCCCSCCCCVEKALCSGHLPLPECDPRMPATPSQGVSSLPTATCSQRK